MRRTKTMLMGDLLEEFFKRPYVTAKVAEGKLPDTWREIVGDRAAEITTELKIENHILYARIQSSVLRSELFYQREALKEEINRRSGVRLVNAQNCRLEGLASYDNSSTGVLLDGDADKAFLATREELKGDLLVQLGRTDEAYAAYQKAKAALSDEAAVGGLQIKLDDLAKGDA